MGVGLLCRSPVSGWFFVYPLAILTSLDDCRVLGVIEPRRFSDLPPVSVFMLMVCMAW